MDERKTLYREFLKDKRIYNLNVSYWRVKLQKTLEQKISSKEQLFKNKNQKGKGFYDGNPIFSFYNSQNEKAIRIIQEDPEDIVTYTEIKLIEAWFDKVIIPYSENDKEVSELVISLYLTKSSVDKCIYLVTLWFKGELNTNNIEEQLSL
ncbi:hypothetical protein [Flavihumibacter fluvii]|uniref:hypothetical protein n=1 Tax=Flavihumibacter fluvii TaxID=2838157 RepID=UPI001BDEB02C|nr:hypothetical protein [Flavihumibacter fluvii]ULQ51702.1 hypothetical protein KJS93_16560 [Flavihumibacter fluvii]